jgi:HEAT repeat protein
MMNDPDPSVRTDAAVKLSATQDPRQVEPLIAALKDPVTEVRRVDADLLGRTKDRRAVDPLLALLEKDSDPNVRVNAIMALIDLKLDDTRELQPLIAALHDPDDGVRAWVPDALGNIHDPRSFQAILDALATNDYNVTMEAARVLGHLRNPRAIEPLLASLKDGRGYAAAALSEIGTPAIEPLIATLKNPDPVIRMGAAEALSENTVNYAIQSKGDAMDPRAVRALLQSAQEHDLAVIAGAHLFFMRHLDPGVLDDFSKILYQHTGRDELIYRIADDLLNSANPELVQLTVGWAKKHGIPLTKDAKGRTIFMPAD